MKPTTTPVKKTHYEKEFFSSYYHHITNGGLSMSVYRDVQKDEKGKVVNDGYGATTFHMSYSHMGNGASIDIWEFDPNALRKFSEMLMIAASKIEEDNNVAQKEE